MAHRLHVISLPHTQTIRAYSACAFTEKVRKFCTMMTLQSNYVALYASTENEAEVSALHPCVTTSEQECYGFLGPEDYLKIQFDGRGIWENFNLNVVRQLSYSIQPEDIICHITRPPQMILDAFPHNLHVEFGVGYEGVGEGTHKVFESYAWMHAVNGWKYGAANSNVRYFDDVIPNYFEVDQFDVGASPKDYYLYLGRLTDRKGWRIAQDVCERLGLRLIIAGPGEFSGYGEYVGQVGPDERRLLLADAIATFVPTQYLGPFESVAVESMISGAPVITTDFGAFTETVHDGVNGFRCKSFREFCDSAVRVRDLDRVSVAAQARAAYSTEVLAGRYQDYFDQLCTLYGEGWYA